MLDHIAFLESELEMKHYYNSKKCKHELAVEILFAQRQKITICKNCASNYALGPTIR